MDLAAPKVEVDAVVRHDGAESLRDAAQLECRGVGRHFTVSGMFVILPEMMSCWTFSIWRLVLLAGGAELAVADAAVRQLR